jgi:hypothetical protein
MMKPRRKKRRNLAWAKKVMGTNKQAVIARLFNIEKLARHLGVAETDDFDRFLIAWVWCNPEGDICHLMDAAKRMGGSLNREQAEAAIDEAKASKPQRTAAQIGRFLGVTDEIRQRLRLWTIRPMGVTKEELMARRKRKGQEREQQRRRARGARSRAEYEANSLSRTKPWEAYGVVRRTWERWRAAGLVEHGTGDVASPCAVPLGNRAASTLATSGRARMLFYYGSYQQPASYHSLAASTGKPSAGHFLPAKDCQHSRVRRCERAMLRMDLSDEPQMSPDGDANLTRVQDLLWAGMTVREIAQATGISFFVVDMVKKQIEQVQGPMLSSQRRIEGRIGQLLGPATLAHDRSKGATSVVTEVAKDDRSDFRIIAKAGGR